MNKEIVIPRIFELLNTYRIGSKGEKVRLVQELLVIHGFHTVIDGIFGPATKDAVEKFQEEKGIKVNGVVSDITIKELMNPFRNINKAIPVNGRSLGEMVAAYAEQHLAEHPREVGGQNRGPWVRLYMNGNEGPEWPWCAGFVSTILKQACYTIGINLPFRISFSCDLLAINAMKKKRFLRGHKVENQKKVLPGNFFLVRRSSQDWVHTGIVINIDIGKGIFYTIEGNTNDSGSREGYEVCKRTRSFKSKDFIVI
jgi:hypothetical protein